MSDRRWTRGIGHQVVGFTTGWNFGSTAAVKQKVYDGVVGGQTKTLRQGNTLLAGTGGVGALVDPQTNLGLPFNMLYGGIQVTSTHTAASIQAVVDAAERRGHTASILFHRIVANSATPASLEMKVSEAATALEYLADRVRLGGVYQNTVDRLEGIAY